MKKIKVLFYETGAEPKLLEIENTLEAMQKLVGGHIEHLTFSNGYSVICNEDGICRRLPINRIVYPFGKDESTETGIFGDFFIVKEGAEEFLSVDPDVNLTHYIASIAETEKIVQRIIQGAM